MMTAVQVANVYNMLMAPSRATREQREQREQRESNAREGGSKRASERTTADIAMEESCGDSNMALGRKPAPSASATAVCRCGPARPCVTWRPPQETRLREVR